MLREKIKLACKAALCLLLCLVLFNVNKHRAQAQTQAAPSIPAASNAAVPASGPITASPTGSPLAATPPPAMSAPPVSPLPANPPPAIAAAPPTAPEPSAPGPGAAAIPPSLAPPLIKVSILGMVRNSDPIVQAVMAFLLVCSAGSWAAFLYKSVTLAVARRNTRRFTQAFGSSTTMESANSALNDSSDGPAKRMWLAAKQEWDATLRATGTPLAPDQTSRLLQRLVLAMGSSQERSMTRLGSWMGLLATVGSTAPFIGLFGTVWGILDSFEHISASYNTSLTVVAPGIAEALLATAVGLFAAIPATMFYNRFAREVGKITGMLDNVTADIVVFASRDVERLGK